MTLLWICPPPRRGTLNLWRTTPPLARGTLHFRRYCGTTCHIHPFLCNKAGEDHV